MVAAKHCFSMLLGTMCHSLEHISDHYDMVEVEDHFRVDCTSIVYVLEVFQHLLRYLTVIRMYSHCVLHVSSGDPTV
jgi:hypothetical protein